MRAILGKNRGGIIRLVSWNVNGLRSVNKKGFLEWLIGEQADIVCLQETRVSDGLIPEDLKDPPGYSSFFNHAERKGYSGVGLYLKPKPLSISYGIGNKTFDTEGRVIQADFKDFTLLNIYFPNGSASQERLSYKMSFYDAFLKFADSLRKDGKRLIICGDFNTAHKEIDLARPKDNIQNSGFLPEERAWMDKFIKAGYTDTFRHFCDDPHEYTWWAMRTAARQRNVGWRIDYFFSTNDLVPHLVSSKIHQSVTGSDHCPISLELKL